MSGETGEERNGDLVEGEHFYFENGLMVFTAAYLQKRGFCCQSGCRHCPYGFRRESEAVGIEKSNK
ncbi:MAG TPA: DUF5522 domain-containing protein [Terriglobales bacterium]|nr:DUF5522 domain-containing protein [Terriglobales bacterium]